MPPPTTTGFWTNATVGIWYGHIGDAAATVALSSTLVSKPFRLVKVMVNVPDQKVRTNRLTLLHNLLTEFSTIADFSEIVTSGDHK